jgi:hypothetical protein
MQVRTLFTVGVLVAGVIALSACGSSGSNASSVARAKMQREATLYEIDQIERKFHEAGSTHNVNLMMSLWAPGSTFNLGGQTYTGKTEIRKFFAQENPVFQAKNHWVSDTPSYKIKITQDGDKATLHMECDFIDLKTGEVKAAVVVDHNLEKINGKWLIVTGSGAPGGPGTPAVYSQ